MSENFAHPTLTIIVEEGLAEPLLDGDTVTVPPQMFIAARVIASGIANGIISASCDVLRSIIKLYDVQKTFETIVEDTER